MNYKRYRFSERYAEDQLLFFLQAPKLNGLYPEKSQFFSSEGVFMDLENLLKSKYVDKAENKTPPSEDLATSTRKKRMLVLTPDYNDPLYDADGCDWNAMYFALWSLGFNEVEVQLQSPSQEEEVNFLAPWFPFDGHNPHGFIVRLR